MFGLGNGEKAELQKLWAAFRDVRETVLRKQQRHEQYAFAASISHFPNEPYYPTTDNRPATKTEWKLFCNEMHELSKKAQADYAQVSGVHGETARAGALAIAFLFLLARANVLSETGSRILIAEMLSFRNEIQRKFDTAPEIKGERQP